MGNSGIESNNENRIRELEERVAGAEREFNLLFNEMPSGFALHEMIFDSEGHPIDYRFLQVNKAFEKITGLNSNDIIGKTVLEVLPNIEYSWIEFYGNVVSTGKSSSILDYSSELDRYFEVQAYCPQKGLFTSIISDITDKKRIELELEKNRLFIEKVLNTVPTVSYIYDLKENKIVYSNQGIQRILGYTTDEIIEFGSELFAVLATSEDYKAIKEHHNKLNVAKDGEILEIEYRLKKNNGSWCVLHSYDSVFEREKDGSVSQIAGAAIDITENKNRQQELLDIKALLESVIEQSPVGMAIASKNDGKFKYFNKAGQEFMGLDSNIDFIDKEIKSNKIDWLEVNFKRELKPAKEIPLFRALKGEATNRKEYMLKRRDGSSRYCIVDGVPIFNMYGDVIAGTVFFQDITERMEAEEIIAESEVRFKTMIEESSIPMVLTDRKQDIILFNKKFTELFGYDLNDVSTAQQWWETAYPDMVYRAKVQKEWDTAAEEAIKFGTDIKKQIWNIVCKNGENKTIEFSFVNLGEINILTMYDITELKIKEQELNSAKEKAEESDRLKSAFLANMSHEIRTPMNGLIGFVDLLTQNNVTDEKKKFYTNVINDSCNQLLNIINDILDISKIETNQFIISETEFDLNEFLLEIYSFFMPQAKTKDINIILNKGFDEHGCRISADKEKLRQVLNNLIANAVKFTHQGVISVGYGLMNNNIRFYIKDTGIGIAPEHQINIFERFRQADITSERKYGGTGLGLAIAKGFVEMLDGEIWCVSTLGEGSTFYFTIPYKLAKQEDSEDIDNEIDYQDEETISVLVAEDEEINYLFIEEILLRLNVKTIQAINGEEAIRIIKENINVKLILMDIKMPIMDGYQATKEIKRIRPDIPIIAQTAYALPDDEKQAFDSGCDAYISKPIRKEKLISLVNSFLLKLQLENQ